MQFFNVEDIINERKECRVFYIIGARGVGKSYSTKKYIVKNYLTRGERFIYVRRWTTEIQGHELATTFDDVVGDSEIKELWERWQDEHGKTYAEMHILPKGGQFWLCGVTDKDELDYLKSVGKITCISKATQLKGAVLNLGFTSILFDEFITEMGYVHGRSEPELFQKICMTAGRANNTELRTFLLGNPDANIELNPYIAASLTLDYQHIQVNTPMYYDTITPEGRRIANNVCFIKLAPTDSVEKALNSAYLGVWHTSEEEMSYSGEVKTSKHLKLAAIDEKNIHIKYKIIMETPIITEHEFKKKLYCYYGYWLKEPCVVILSNHSERFDAQVSDRRTLYARYNRLEAKQRDYRQMYRMNIPDSEYFKELKSIISGVQCNRFVFTDDDFTATTYEQIVIQSD